VIKKKSRKIGFGLLVEFFLQNVFCSVFELPSLKNTRKCDKTKAVEEKLTSKFLSKFWEKFSTRTFCQNILNGVFESPCRETPKNVLKEKVKQKKVGQWIFVLRSALCLVSRPAALGFAACGTCLSPAPALVWL
jgi:hypothetical protein